MGNNPVRAAQAGGMLDPEKDSSSQAVKARQVRQEFITTLSRVVREHRERINAVLKTIDERQIHVLKEKLKSL